MTVSRCGDTDGDGIPDEADACPSTAIGDLVGPAGCSCTQLDGDADGVNNCNDICPNTSAGGLVDALGCLCSQRDDDSDGVDNCDDVCPQTAVGAAVTGLGCSSQQLDDDQDGVMNPADACPVTPPSEISDGQGCSFSQRQFTGTEAGAQLTDVESNQGAAQGSRGGSNSTCGVLGTVNPLLLAAGLAAWKGRRPRVSGR